MIYLLVINFKSRLDNLINRLNLIFLRGISIACSVLKVWDFEAQVEILDAPFKSFGKRVLIC